MYNIAQELLPHLYIYNHRPVNKFMFFMEIADGGLRAKFVLV